MAEREVIPPQSCILFATADWDDPYWTNKQHCAKSLAELGTKVLYVESVGLRRPKANSAKDWGRIWNRFFKGLASLIFGAPERSLGIYVLSPLVVPAGHRHAITREINRLLFKAAIARATRGQGFVRPLIWTYHPFMLDVIDGMPKGPLLYHCVDDLAAVPGVDATSFRAAEKDLLKRADVVFATAPSLADHCRQYNDNTHYLSNVVDAMHFGRALEDGPIPADLECIPEPRLCYHGVLSDFKIDFQLLIDCALLKPEWNWVFIGEEREGQKSPLVAELRKIPNVHFLGYKRYEELPDYLRGIQVGLLPSLINEYTKGMFPMKYYEYLAAGLPVVSTSLDFAKSGDFSGRFVEGLTSFVLAINSSLKEGVIPPVLADHHTWRARTRIMLALKSQTSDTRTV